MILLLPFSLTPALWLALLHRLGFWWGKQCLFKILKCHVLLILCIL